MTPAKLKRKTKNHLLSMARATLAQLSHTAGNAGFGANNPDVIDILHDNMMRAYAEGYTHGQASGREAEESKR